MTHDERRAAVAALREVCGEHGDNNWPDEMHLGDVVEKHLARHLRGATERPTLNAHDDARRIPVTLYLLPEHVDQLARRAAAETRTVSEVVEDALSDANIVDDGAAVTIRTYRSRATTSIGAGGRMLIATREDASPRGRSQAHGHWSEGGV